MKHIAEVLFLEELHDEEVAQFAFGFFRVLFGLRAVVSKRDEFRFVEDAFIVKELLAEFPPLLPAGNVAAVVGAFEIRRDGPMDRKIGIAADGAGEVRVMLAREGVVADHRRAVTGLGESSQDGEVDRAGRGGFGGGFEELLNVLARGVVGDFPTRDHREGLQRIGLADGRVGVGPAG